MDYLAHPYFLQFAVPLVSVGLSIFVKYVTRNDKHVAFKKEDVAVGLDVAITALIIFITHSVSLARAAAKGDTTAVAAASAVPWMLLAFVVGIWAASTIVRKKGWERADRLHLWWGIVLPDAFGLLTLIFVVNWISER